MRPSTIAAAAPATAGLGPMAMKVLVPVDDSAVSLHAIDWVSTLQRAATPIELELVNVRNEPESYGAVSVLDYGAVERALREAQQQVLARALRHAEAAGLTCLTAHAAHGVPAEEIVRTAETHGVDQIVMATHGRGAVGRLFLGSVAQRVAYLAPMPVTLVR